MAGQSSASIFTNFLQQILPGQVFPSYSIRFANLVQRPPLYSLSPGTSRFGFRFVSAAAIYTPSRFFGCNRYSYDLKCIHSPESSDKNFIFLSTWRCSLTYSNIQKKVYSNFWNFFSRGIFQRKEIWKHVLWLGDILHNFLIKYGIFFRGWWIKYILCNGNHSFVFWMDEIRIQMVVAKVIHSEKRFDWIKENYSFERLSLI